jgi:hypothetical protein
MKVGVALEKMKVFTRKSFMQRRQFSQGIKGSKIYL